MGEAKVSELIERASMAVSNGYMQAASRDLIRDMLSALQSSEARIAELEKEMTGATDSEVFYRVKARHPNARWQVGDLGDGYSDPLFAENYYRHCIEGGWPVVRLETVRVTFVKEHGSSEDASHLLSEKGGEIK